MDKTIDGNSNNQLFNKLFNYVCKHKVLLINILSVIIFLLSRLWQPINWGVLPLFVIFAVFANVTQIYSVFMFIYSFAGIFSVYVGAAGGQVITLSPVIMVISGIILLIKHIVLVVKKEQKVALLPAIISVVILAYSFLFFSTANYYHIMSAFMVLLLGYVTFIFYKDIDFVNVIRMTVLGILVSTGICLLIQFIPSQFNFVWMSNRFQALSGHPNSLQIGCICTISLLMVLKFKEKIGLLEFAVSSILVGVIGIFTLSKAYYLCLLGLVILYMIMILIKNKKKGLIQCLCMIVCVAVVCLIFRKQCVEFFKRFTMFFNASSIWNQITTGRYGIWQTYFASWLKSPISIIFGYGLSSVQPVSLGAHNDYLYILRNVGIVGALLIMALLISYLYLVKDKKKRFSVINIMPLVLIMILSIEETILIKTEFIFIIFAFILLFDKEAKIDYTAVVVDKSKLVSIVVPCYNSAKYIEKCLDSIFKQTYECIEIIVVDDGSKDNSIEILQGYANKGLIKVIKQKNKGVSATRNVGVNNASGDYICFVDSDDTLQPNYVDRLLGVSQQLDCDIVCCGFNYITESGVQELPYKNQLLNLPDDIDKYYLNEFFGYPWNKLYKANILTCKFNEKLSFAEDEIFNIEVLNNVTKVATIEDCLYNYYRSQNSLASLAKANFFVLNENLYDIRKNLFIDIFNPQISSKLSGQKLLKSVIVSIGYSVLQGKKYSDVKSTIKEYCNNSKIRECLSGVQMNGLIDKACKYLIKFKCYYLLYVMACVYAVKKR